MTPYARAVHYYETDAMGIVHHANYLRYFEEARVDLLRQMGIPYETWEQAGILSPILSSNLRYQKPLAFADSFTVHCQLTAYNGVTMSLAYQMVRESDKAVCVVGETSHCFVQKEGFRPVRLSRACPMIHAGLEQFQNEQKEKIT